MGIIPGLHCVYLLNFFLLHFPLLVLTIHGTHIVIAGNFIAKVREGMQKRNIRNRRFKLIHNSLAGPFIQKSVRRWSWARLGANRAALKVGPRIYGGIGIGLELSMEISFHEWKGQRKSLKNNIDRTLLLIWGSVLIWSQKFYSEKGSMENNRFELDMGFIWLPITVICNYCSADTWLIYLVRPF